MHSHINLAPTQDENRMCLNSDRIERGRQRDRRPKRDDSKDWLRESEQSKVKNFGRCLHLDTHFKVTKQTVRA